MQLNFFIPSLSLKISLFATGLVIVLLTGAAPNNQPQLSPTVLLPGDNSIASAVGNQTFPQIAGGANGFLVVWQDNRSQIYDSIGTTNTCGNWVGTGAGNNNDIYAARMDVEGHLLDPTPIILSHTSTCQSKPGVAWNGQNWLVVWTSQRDDPFETILEGVRVSPAGQVLDETPILISRNVALFSYLQLTSDGINWTIIWSGGRSINGIVMLANGMVDTSGPKLLYLYSDPLPPTVQINADIAFAGDEYLLSWTERVFTTSQNTSMLKVLRLNNALTPIGSVLTLRSTANSTPCVATDGQNFLVAMGNLGWLIARSGQIIFSELPLSQSGGVADICWDGSNYYAAGGKEALGIFVAMIAPNGIPISESEIDLKPNDRNFDIAIAPSLNGRGTRVVWTTQTLYQPHADSSNTYFSKDLDVLTAGVTSNRMVSSVTTVSVSAPRQSLAQIAAGNDGFLVVYRSQTANDSRIMSIKLDANGNPVGAEPIQLDGGYPGLTNPAVVWNGSSYLAVWENSEEPAGGITAQQGTIYGKRLGPDGSMLDATPFRISRGKNASIATLNTEFLIVSNYEFDGSVFLTKISANGQIIQSSTILPASLGINGGMKLSKVTPLGNRWLMVWVGADSSGCNCIWGSFINQQGVATNAFKISGPLGDCQVISWGLEPQLASAGDAALVIYRGRTTASFAHDLDLYGGIVARKIKSDGTFADNNLRGFTVSPNGYIPSVAWDGYGYLATWLDPRNALYPKMSSGDIFATRIGAEGAVKDVEGFAIAASPLPEDRPVVAAHNGIGVFAWSGFVGAPYSTMRILLRTVKSAFVLPPAAPLLRPGTNSTWNQISFDWIDQADNEDGFKIERCTGNSCTDFTEIAQVPANTNSFTDTKLMPRTWYKYRLKAFNSGGFSSYTSEAISITLDPPSFSITGRLTDRDGRGLENYSLTLTGTHGGFARTDRSGYYRLSSIAGGNYRITVQSPGPRIGFTTYFPNPGWVEFNYITANQSANFIYNLTSPWVPPGATPPPTPTPAPTPTPSPSPGGDATILNPNFDQGGANWITSGAVSFPNGIARLTPTTNFSPASILQWVEFAPGATYEVSADITATATTRLSFGVRFDEGGNIITGPSASFTNVTRPTNIRLRFTIPSGINQVGFYAMANGSVSNNSLATIDNFRLIRVN